MSDTSGNNVDVASSADDLDPTSEGDSNNTTIVGAALGSVVLLLLIVGGVQFYHKRNITNVENNNNLDEQVRVAAAETVQNSAFGISLDMQETYGEVESRASLEAAGSHVQQAYGGVQPASGAAPGDAAAIDYATIDEALGAVGDLEDPDYLEPSSEQPAVYAGLINQTIQQSAVVVETGTCARGKDSGGRACKRPISGGEVYCDNHTCGRPGCTASKSSSDDMCRHHAAGFGNGDTEA